jgi:hypothetical protein
MMPLSAFSVKYEELIRDLDFLNVEYKNANLERIDIEEVCASIRASSWSSQDSSSKQESRESADTLILALRAEKLKFSQLSNRNKSQVYESVLFIASHSRVFGLNQRSNLKEATKHLPFTVKQREKLDRWFQLNSMESDTFDTDYDSDYDHYDEGSDYYYYSSD